MKDIATITKHQATTEEEEIAGDSVGFTCRLDKNLNGEFTLGFYTQVGTYQKYQQFKRDTAKKIRQLAQDLGLDAIDRI